MSLSVAGNSNPGLLSAQLLGTSLTLDYVANQSGSTVVTIRATDVSGAFVEDSFNVTVTPVNDTPTVANPIADVTVAEDAANTVLDLSSVFADIDAGDVLSVSVAGNSNPGLVSAQLLGTSLTLDYVANQSGSTVVTIRATDVSGAFVEDTFTVTVTPQQEEN